MLGIEIKGQENLKQYLSKLQKDQLKGFKSKVGLIGIRDIQQHFRNSASPNGKWKALKYRTGMPLLKTGTHLLQTISEAQHGDNSVEIGTNAVMARIHNYGGYAGRNRKVKIEQREYMWLSDDADNKIAAVLTNSWEKL